ncbi:helicase SRCAP isoform X2 [Myripristis murdjan]|uniref:helicase SRCAP isoform X2 n=1 Tax=Myripristis murdjan TaxID=586833 RepID=UPI001175C8B3|nr:helicase SRCAP isoform X2 [Myripristis murdjan]
MNHITNRSYFRFLRICGGDPNLSILEVESTEDLCLTPQTGAVCSQGSTEGGSSGGEAVQQCAPPAVDVLGGDPQAAQNVAGVSPQHALQPVAAAPLPVPPLTIPSKVPPPEINDSAFFGVEKAPSTTSFETLPVSANAKDGLVEEGPTVESVAEGVRGGGSLPASLTEDCNPSAEMQRVPAPFVPPPPPSDTQTDSTAQELHYGSQTDKEKSHSDSQTNQIQPPGEIGELVITGTEEGEPFSDRDTLEYTPETGTNEELGGREHTVKNILPQPHSQFCSTSSPPVLQSSVDFTVKDTTEDRGMEQSHKDPLAQANQSSHIPLSDSVEQPGGHQNSKPAQLSVPVSDSSESKQTDFSATQLKIIRQLSNNAGETQGENAVESIEILEHYKELVEISHKETQPASSEMVEAPEAGETTSRVYACPGKGVSSSTDGGEERNDNERSCNPSAGEPMETSKKEEQTHTSASSSNFAVLPECSSLQESSTEPLSFDTDLADSRQVEFVEAETSHPPDQALTVETPLISELMHSADGPGIVIVREEAHISGDWSDVHLNQSYLLQQEDGSVCQAAVVNELSTGEPKLYGDGVQADIEIDSQPVEMYEICELVEEVAEETICASSSAQLPHSPGYEVNLFNPLLDHTDEYTGKEELDSHLEAPLHTINESTSGINSQQAFSSSHDSNEMEVCSNNSHIMQNTMIAAVGQHLVLEANQAVELTDSTEVCLVQTATDVPDSFTIEQTNTNAQIVERCLQTDTAVSDQTNVSVSPVIHTLPTTQEAEATTASSSPVSAKEVVTGEEIEMASSLDTSVTVSHLKNHPSLKQSPGVTVVSATKPEASVSSYEGTKENPNLIESPSHKVKNVPVTTETKPEACCSMQFPGILNPKLLILKQGETPLLKHPPSLLAQVSKQQNAAGMLASAHSSRSGTVSEECLPQTVSAADSVHESVAVSSQKDQTQCSVNKTSATTPPTKAQQPVTTNSPSQLCLSAPAPPKTSQSKSDKEALIATLMSTREADAEPQNIVTTKDANPPSKTLTLDVPLASVGRAGKDPVSSSLKHPVRQSDPLCQSMEDEGEEMEQGRPSGEAGSRQASSPDEGSDEEPEADKTQCGMTTPSSTHKVRQWIADRVTVSSSPVSPSTSSPSPGPSSTSDWSTPRRERASPLRGPHGKFLSPSSVGPGVCSSSSSPPDQTTPHRPRGERHTDMAELAKHEADIEHRTQALKREGFWSMKRLTRLTEPVRPKVHWDYLCEEMQWLSADFAQERRWKRGVARKVVRMVMRHHEELRQKEEKAKRDEHAKIRRVASSIAKEVRAFWSSVEKVVQYKQQSRLEEKRKKALDLQLDFIVGQTEKYSDLLSQSLAPTRPTETVTSPPRKSFPSTIDEDDRDFEPTCEEEDDEETIEVEEQQEGNDAESHRREIELLKEEGMIPLDQLLSTLKRSQDSGSDEECSDETSSSVEEEDGEFTANEEDAEDEEDTIAAQEKVEGNVDHAEELDDLAREGDMSIEELLEKYKGAYASDFEEPSASASKASSDSEVSGDEEEETEEDESDVESNTSSSDSPEDSEEDDDSEKDEEESEEEEEDVDCGDEGMEALLKEGDHSPPSSSSRPKKEISHIAATAESLQPKGYTLATTKVKTPIPFLLHGTLREYQHIGLDWLVTMYEKKLNGILADEMGLGKTIQTIALLAHLACEKGNWGPHLIIVPTSVMLNWEMELKRWCPGFKILTYFGSQKERKLKRQGWTKPNAFHVCITSYKLVLQDHQAFRRKSWRYLILDEAQNIKNFKSQRWQSLLNFNSHRRLLLTGTPLQNSLMELWSLMHFLMPHVFQSHREFKEWFSNPLTGMIEGSQEYNEGLVKRLHKVLRPFLLRRIKADVEKQMPKKYEHVVRCRLSKRQRFLYDDFMAQASTRETLASGHFMSVINILMQLRKVCNHPNLFDPRPIQSPFITQPIVFHTASLVQDALEVSPFKRCDLSMFDLVGLEGSVSRYQADSFLPHHKVSRQLIQEIMDFPEPPPRPKPVRMKVNRMFQPPPKGDSRPVLLMNKPTCPVSPAAQTPKPQLVTDTPTAPAPAPIVQQVVCSVTPTPTPRPSVHPTAQTAVRSNAPKPVLTVRPPTTPCTPSAPAHPSPPASSVMPQRVLLSPDMQARLPSGEVVSIAQLASLAGRPVSTCQGSKPVTFQLQGNKLTLSGAQIHQVPVAPPRPVQAPASMVSSPGIVKIVVRQSAGKEGGPVPTLAVAPSPRVAPQASPSLHQHANTPPVRNPAPLQNPHRTPGPATAHYTIAPPRIPSSTPSQPQPPRPVLKVVQPPPSSTEQPAPARVTSSSSSSKSSAPPHDDTCQTLPPKSGSGTGVKASPRPRVLPRPPPRSPFHMSWLADSNRQQRDSRMDLIFRVNERHCGAKPVYGQEVLDFLTFLPSSCPSPAPLSAQGEWGRSGHSSCLFAQFQNTDDYWLQSHILEKDIHSIEERLELLSDIIDRFTFVIPPVEAPPISMHCCHPPPSLSHKQAVFSSMLSTQLTPLTGSLHRIQCNMRTHFPDLRLIQYDCGKLQTLHTLLRKLKTGGHRVLIFTQMTRMLDVLEQFLNYHGHIYLRLDGSTRVEQRQALMERFNADRRIFCFILSTRSGGVGVNLTGADTVVFYDSDWNPTMDAQAQDRCHRIGQTRDVHIYRLISERTVEENILKKANQKRMLGDMAIEGGNFTTAFFKEQTIRELFDVNDGEKREVAVELSVPQAEEEESVNKQNTTILEQALCRAEDEEDIVAASQAKAEQVAELAEFNENIPLDDGGEQEEVEELSKAEQEIAALVEQLTPIERYAMNFLEASLEDVCKEELKQAEEQVEAARKGLDQAKEEGLKLHASSDDDDDDFLSPPASVEPVQPTPARRGRKPKDRSVTSTRTSGRLRGASPETEPDPPTLREVPERLRFGLRGRGAAKDTAAVSTTPSRTDHHKTSSSSRLQDSSKSSKASSPARDHQAVKTRALPNRSLPNPVPSTAPTSPPGGKPQTAGETDSRHAWREEKEGENEKQREVSECSPESNCPVDHQLYSAQARDDDSKEQGSMSPPSACSRSPRKRQSADGEVLRGLVEDSPSAKVLRKLPGRLVTVVEEKEPRRRRRRGSGTGGGGSSEETTTEEHTSHLADEPSRDHTPQSPDNKTKGTLTKSAQDQDSTPNLTTHPQPVRGYPPYSPPHLSPDMPVLRNLPVRRRLETESRMAAQLGEQQQHLGRGRGGNQPRKTDTPPGKDSTSTEPNVNSVVAPMKRKRGRPPKTPPRVPEPELTVSPPPQPTSPSEEGSPPLSPKRKRGRPRKDSMTAPDTVGAGQNSNKNPSTTTIDESGSLSNTAASTEPGILSPPTKPEPQPPTAAAVSLSQAFLSTKAEESGNKTEAPDPDLASATNPALTSTSKVNQAFTSSSAQVSVPTTSQAQVSTPTAPTPLVPHPSSNAKTSASMLPSVVSTSTPAQVISSAPATVPCPATPSAQVSFALSIPLPIPVPVPIPGTQTTTAPAPPTTTVPTAVPSPKPTLTVSTASKPIAPATVKTAVPDPVKTTTVGTSAPTTPSKPCPAPSSVTTVKTVPMSAPSTTITTATTTVATTLNLTPAATSTVKTVSVPKTTVVTNMPAASALPTTAAAPTTPTATISATISSPTTSCVKPAASSPTAAATNMTGTTATMVKAVESAPTRSGTVPTSTSAKSVTAATSTPVITVAANTTSAVNKVTASAAQARTNVTATTISTKLVSTSATAKTSTVATQLPVTAVTVATTSSAKSLPLSTCTPVPATVTTSVTAQAKTATVTTLLPTKGVKGTTPSSPPRTVATPYEQLTTCTPVTTIAKTVTVTSPVTTATGAAPAPVRTLTVTTSAPITVATVDVVTETTQASTATATSVSVSTVATTTAAANKIVPLAATTQTSAVISSPLHNSASSSISPKVSMPAQKQALPVAPTSAPSIVSSAVTDKQSLKSAPKESAPNRDSENVTDMEVDAVEAEASSGKEVHDKKQVCKPQPKKRKVESSSEAKDSVAPLAPSIPDTKTPLAPQKEEPKQQAVEESVEDEKVTIQKRPLSRQSSQESARSSSPSSGCSTSTLTRHAHHKRTYENRHPAKRRRVDVTSEAGKEEKGDEKDGEKREEGSEKEVTGTSRRRRSRSSSSSSESDNCESRKERRLTRSAKRGLQDQEKDRENNRQGKRPARNSDRSASNNAATSTGGESGSDTSSVRVTRKSVGSQPVQDTKPQTNSVPSVPPEPEVLGKRCSALNAAAKLLAMKGRVDTPGHTTRKDSGAKTAGTSPASSVDKNQKPKSKSVPASPQSNSVNLSNNKASGSKSSTPTQSSRSASRSTRQCPGSLVPPLEMEYKRCKPEEKERGSKKSSEGKEGEGETQSSRGHSACSSMSSDGEGDGGGRSSRSRSSSNSSQRTPSVSSQNTEPRESHSRAASSGSEREQDRSSDRAKRRDKKEGESQTRESRKDSRRSQKLSQEVSSSSGTEGTPDRVLRSVTALAAVQARSPAASTRSSSSQHRHNKT